MLELGEPVPEWRPPPRPGRDLLIGRWAELQPLSVQAHGRSLFAANSEDPLGAIWDYLPYGPFERLADYEAWLTSVAGLDDPVFFAIRDKRQDRVCGVASYLRIQPEAGSIEVGHINFAPALQNSTAATDAMYLMMRWAFDSGYRRYEWKCNALNRPSRAAAQRLGLSFEGVFRQSAVVKGRNRDTAWFAAIDKEWPALRQCFETYLAADNFDTQGCQKRALSAMTAAVLYRRDPSLDG